MNRAEIWISAFACVFSGIAAIASVAGAWVSWKALDQMQGQMAADRDMDACVALARASDAFNGAVTEMRQTMEQDAASPRLAAMTGKVEDAQKAFDLAAIALTYLVDDRGDETIAHLGDSYAAVSSMIAGGQVTPQQVSQGMAAVRPGETALRDLCGGLVRKTTAGAT